MHLSVKAPSTYFFRPELGSLERRFIKLINTLPEDDDVLNNLDKIANDATQSILSNETQSELEIRWAFAISILSDIIALGVELQKIDSSIQITWPNWESEIGHNNLRRALIRLRDEKPSINSTASELCLPPSVTPSTLLDIMTNGDFQLIEANNQHPCGYTYHQIFQTGKQYWTMPHRDREGRNKRFVLVVNHSSFEYEMPVGLLEASDGAPHEPFRDKILGLTVNSFESWFNSKSNKKEILNEIEIFLLKLEKALMPIPKLTKLTIKEVYKRRKELERLVDNLNKDSDLFIRKRLTYLIRISRAFKAITGLRDSSNKENSDIYSLVRLFRDLFLPRIHLDISLCGALPPFSVALGGKLVASFISDPRILNICKTPPGQILRSVFNIEKIVNLLPNKGALLLTTKGLYPGHSVQYKNAVVPGHLTNEFNYLHKIGKTRGETASLISRRSYVLASILLESRNEDHNVSNVFGSGSSKRQRRIALAVQKIGLPKAILQPRIERPVYAIETVTNLKDVIILNKSPHWCIPTDRGPEDYAKLAIQAWRKRWGAEVKKRVLRQNGEVYGLRDWYNERMRLHE